MSVPPLEASGAGLLPSYPTVTSAGRIVDVYARIQEAVQQNEAGLAQFPLRTGRRGLDTLGKPTYFRHDVPGLPLALRRTEKIEIGEDGNRHTSIEQRIIVVTAGGLYEAPLSVVHDRAWPLLDDSDVISHNTRSLGRDYGDLALLALNRFSIAMKRQAVLEASFANVELLRSLLGNQGIQRHFREGVATEKTRRQVLVAQYIADMFDFYNLIQDVQTEKDKRIAASSLAKGQYPKTLTANERADHVIVNAVTLYHGCKREHARSALAVVRLLSPIIFAEDEELRLKPLSSSDKKRLIRTKIIGEQPNDGPDAPIVRRAGQGRNPLYRGRLQHRSGR